ncbi:MAG: GNAT family N-acetyltransferase [Syntrophorhabdaceae bacterium]
MELFRKNMVPGDNNAGSAGTGKMAGIFKNIAFFMCSRTKMFFYEYIYPESTPMQSPADDFIYRTLLPADYGKLLESLMVQRSSEKKFFRPIDIENVVERLKRGDICYIGEKNGEIAGYCWFARHSFYISQISHAINLEPTDLYLYNAYVLKPYRRHNITTGNIFAARRDLVPLGFSREIIATMHWNTPSRQFALKMGFEEAGSITVGYILTLRYTINRCRGLKLSGDTGTFDFYQKLFAKIRSYGH